MSARRGRKRELFAATIVLSACSAACSLALQEGRAWQKPELVLPDKAAVLVAQIADGSGADGVVLGSGEWVARDLNRALTTRGFKLYASSSAVLPDLLVEARRKGAPFVLVGLIPKWEDNATGWSGKRDYASLTLELYASDSGELVAGSSRVARGLSRPYNCVEWLVDICVKALLAEPLPAELQPPC